MIKRLAVTGALLLAAGCTSPAKSSAFPEDTKIRELIAKLAPAMPCDQPRDSQTDRSVRAECDHGEAFVEAYPDAASVRAEFTRLAGLSGGDYLVGEDGTWFAGAGLLDGLERMRSYLGGRIQHVRPQNPTG